jgi:O-antigen/teichoic acid export membrane protein
VSKAGFEEAGDAHSTDAEFKPAFTLMAARAAAFAITFLTPIVLVRLFTQEEFGTYKQFLLVTYTFFSIAQIGFSESLFYFLPKRPDCAGRFVLNSLLILLLSGAVCMAGLVMNTGRIADWMSNAALAGYVPVIGAYLLFMLMGTVLEITMISLKRYKLAAGAYVASDLLRAIFLVVPALITRSLLWALVASVVFLILRVGAMVAYFRSEFGAGLRFDRVLLKEQWTYAVPFALTGLLYVIQQNYHQYVVAYHFDAATFAIYSVGCLQIPLVDFVATPASNVMMIQMTEELRDRGARRLLPIWHNTTRKLALMLFPFTGLLVVNAYQLITFLFTQAYATSVPIFVVWCLSILLTAFQTDGVLRVFAEMRFLFGINITRLILLVLTMSWFLSRFHLLGAVLITIVGMLLAKIMAFIRMKALLETTIGELLPWKSLAGTLAAATAAAAPAVFLNVKLNLPAIVLLPLSGLAYTATYVALVLIFGLLNRHEIDAIKRILYVWNRGSVQSAGEARIGS